MIATLWESPEQDFPIPASVMPLYHVAPYNSNNAQRESLTSLIIRTARAHAVSPRDMIRDVVGKHFKEIEDICKGTFFRHYSAPINGLGHYAQLFTHAFERLTVHSNLTCHCMLPMVEIIASQGAPLIHQGQRWCPACYVEMLESGIDAYRPLLWSLAAASHCPLHGVPLEERCRHCAATQPIIPRWPDIAFCDTCRGALFDRQVEHHLHEPDAPTESRQAWNMMACVNLLAHLHEIDCKLALKNLKIVLEMSISTLCEGNRAEFCRRIGLSIYAFGKILRSENKPTFETLLRIGFVLNLPPSQLLLEHQRPELGTLKIARRIAIPDHGLSRELPRREDEILREFLDYSVPPPVSQVATCIAMTRGGLKYRYPQTYASIVEKRFKKLSKKAQARSNERKAYLRDFIIKTVKAGTFPSKDLVEKALRRRGWSLLRPELRRCYHEMLIEIIGTIPSGS